MFILTKLFLAIAIMDHYQGTAVEISILTRKLFGVLFPGDYGLIRVAVFVVDVFSAKRSEVKGYSTKI